MYYECGICGYLHPWGWNGDCREDANRFTDEQIEPNAEILTMDERVDADLEEEERERLKWEAHEKECEAAAMAVLRERRRKRR